MYRLLVCAALCVAAGCGTVPRETVPLGGNTLTPSVPGKTATYSFVLDNATNGVHATGTADMLTVPYQDGQIADGIAEVFTYRALNRTQYGFPIEPALFSATTVAGLDSLGFSSLLLARGTDGKIRHVTSPVSGAPFFPEGGTLEVGMSFSTGTVTFDDGSLESSSYVVTAVEVIDAPAGRYETYRIECSTSATNSSGTTVESGPRWIHPGVGLIRSESTGRSPQGVITVVMELQTVSGPT